MKINTFVKDLKGKSVAELNEEVLAQVGQASVHVQALYRLRHGDFGTGMVFSVFGTVSILAFSLSE